VVTFVLFTDVHSNNRLDYLKSIKGEQIARKG
jgi:hypothetical protein